MIAASLLLVVALTAVVGWLDAAPGRSEVCCRVLLVLLLLCPMAVGLVRGLAQRKPPGLGPRGE